MTDLPDLEARLAGWVEEAVKLRGALPPIDVGDSPNSLHTQLVKSRAILDRVEEITIGLIRLKGRTHKAKVGARHALRQAEDEAYTSRSVSFDQYITAREREAWVGQRTTDQRADFVSAERFDISVESALEAVKTIRWGIDGYRRDADARLRLMTFERQLER